MGTTAQFRLKPGADTAELIAQIRAAEQPGSGLVRSLFMRDQADPSRLSTPAFTDLQVVDEWTGST